MTSSQPSYTVIPKAKADLSVQEYAKLRKQEKKVLAERKLQQKLLIIERIKKRFNDFVTDIELNSAKWQPVFETIKQSLDKDDLTTLTIAHVKFSELLDSETDLVREIDIPDVFNVIYVSDIRKRINIQGHPLHGCQLSFVCSQFKFRRAAELKRTSNSIKLDVDLREPSWCILV